MEFDWDTGNIEHIRVHEVDPEEAVDAFFGNPVRIKEQEINGEARSVILGKTSSGRLLVIAYTIRGGKVRVVTAFLANRKLRRLYEEAQNA